MTDVGFPGIVIAEGGVSKQFLSALDKATNAWTMRAARGECEWICSGCCTSDHRGMPDECFHGNADCTRIIQRDKAAAIQEAKEGA